MAADRGRAVFGAGVHIFISRFISLRTSAGPFIWFALLAAHFRDFFGIWLWIVLWGFPPLMGKCHFSPIVSSWKMKWKISHNCLLATSSVHSWTPAQGVRMCRSCIAILLTSWDIGGLFYRDWQSQIFRVIHVKCKNKGKSGRKFLSLHMCHYKDYTGTNQHWFFHLCSEVDFVYLLVRCGNS